MSIATLGLHDPPPPLRQPSRHPLPPPQHSHPPAPPALSLPAHHVQGPRGSMSGCRGEVDDRGFRSLLNEILTHSSYGQNHKKGDTPLERQKSVPSPLRLCPLRRNAVQTGFQGGGKWILPKRGELLEEGLSWVSSCSTDIKPTPLHSSRTIALLLRHFGEYH